MNMPTWMIPGLFLALAAASAQDMPTPGDPMAPDPASEGQARRPRDAAPFVDRLIHAVRSKDPAEADRLSRLRESDPEAFRQELRAQLAEMRRTAPHDGHEREARSPRDGGRPDRPPRGEREIPPDRPELVEIRLLVRKYREAEGGPEQEQAMSRLREIVRGMIDQRQQVRRERIARFERELEDMKKDLARIDAETDKIVDRRIQEILRVPRGPDRPDPNTPSAPRRQPESSGSGAPVR